MKDEIEITRGEMLSFYKVLEHCHSDGSTQAHNILLKGSKQFLYEPDETIIN